MNLSTFWGGGGAAPYEIEQSLRFDGSAKLSRTPSSAGTTTTWTLSYWIKVGSLTAEQAILSANPSAGGYTAVWYGVGATSRLKINQYNHPTNVYSKCPTPVYRDPSAWYHVVVVYDSTNATADDRVRFYVNGVRQTDFSDDGSSVGGTTNPSQNQASGVNHNAIHYIGSQFDGTYAFVKSYLAEMHLLDGTAVTDALDFGEYDDNGVWRPIEVSGVTYGTNGFYLKFDPDATNGIGHDHSGNGNNWTASGFTTTGDRTDVVTDTPTDNHCTLNPIEETEVGYESDFEFSEGNLKIVFPSSPPTDHVCGTLCSTGAWYAEVECLSVTRNANVNVLEPGAMGFVGSRPGRRTNPASGYSYSNSGTIDHNATEYTGQATWTAGDVIGIACNVDGNSLRFYKNGTLQKTFTTTRTEPMTIGCDGTDGSGNSSSFLINCGQQPYKYTPPTGYTALSTKNIPAPDIADGSANFNTLLWSGDGNNSRAITGLGFQPDFVWIKRRNQDIQHEWMDAVRGAGNTALSPHTSGEEGQGTTDLSSFDSDGFTLNSGADVNASGGTYVGWSWLAANGTSSNTDGSITSTVSANTTAGFSIVSYTGTGSAATVGHGLGVAPDLIILKARNLSSSNWKVYASVLGDKYLNLNESSAAADAGSGIWNDTAPTSTVFSIGNDYDVNNSSSTTYIAYCFAAVEGYSKLGQYTGNGSSNGPFVYCGFKPALIITSRTDSGTDWKIWDNKRGSYNQNNNHLAANLSGSEQSDLGVDFLSNGFKLRNSGSSPNASGGAYIFMAWASSPFGGSGVSPATAR